ncbi:MAG: hypothetical protein WB816_11590, partial [Methylocystis sp.]
ASIASPEPQGPRVVSQGGVQRFAPLLQHTLKHLNKKGLIRDEPARLGVPARKWQGFPRIGEID